MYPETARLDTECAVANYDTRCIILGMDWTDLRWLRWLVVTVGVGMLLVLARLFLFWPGG